jgi:very-short-patch-repair endonuclease
MDDERRIYELASGQRGLITHAQLRAHGLDDRAIHWRVRIGRLERVHRRVYRLGGAPTDPMQLNLAATMAVGGVVAVSHRAAAQMWGVDLPGPRTPEVTVGATRSARVAPVSAGTRLHRSVDLTPDQIHFRHGVPLTDPARTLVDLGAVVRPSLVDDALDSMVGRKLVTVAGVRARLERLAARGRSGCGVLRQILDERSGAELTMSRSRLEAKLARLCFGAGLPHPVFQHEVVVGGRKRRLDFAFPELRLAIEVDGYESHSRYDVFEDDRRRANDLELAGWTVLRFTWTQITQHPEYVIAVLAHALAHRAA